MKMQVDIKKGKILDRILFESRGSSRKIRKILNILNILLMLYL